MYSHEFLSNDLSQQYKNMPCYFLYNDVLSGNYDVMTVASKSVRFISNIKMFNVVDISKIFTNNMQVIYSDIKSETITASMAFCKLSLNFAQFY